MTTSIRTTSGFLSRASKTASLDVRRPRRRPRCRPALEQQVQAGAHHRVVVHDQHADLASLVTRPAPRPPPSSRLLPSTRRASLPPSSPTRSFIPTRPSPSRPRPGAEALPVVLDHGGHRAVSPGHDDADAGRLRVLRHVRQRLLHDPVERGLDLGRRGARESRFVWMSTAIPVCSPKASASRSSAGARPKSSSALGRSSTASRRTSWSVVDDLLAQLRGRRARRLGELRLLDALQAEQDRGQRLAGLVVELAREPRGARAPAPRPPGAARRGRPARRGRRPRPRARAKVSARRRSSSVKRGSAPELVVRGDHADRAGRRRSSARRAPSAGRRAARAPGRPRRPRASSRPARCAAARARGRSSSRARRASCPTQLLRGRPGGRLDPQVAAAGGDRDHHQLARRSARAAARRSAEQRRQLRLAGDRVADLGQRLELAQPARRRLVQARVLDRDGGLGGEQRDELLVLAR